LSFAHQFAIRSFAAASDVGTTQFANVAIRPGSISHLARVGQVVLAQATDPNVLADEGRVAVA
jgi:hypothetical protein